MDVGHFPSPADLDACKEGAIDNSLAQGFIHIDGGCTHKRNFYPKSNVESATNIHNFINTGPDCYAAIPGLSMFDTEIPEPIHDLLGITIEACKLECDHSDQDQHCLGFRRYWWPAESTRVCKIMYPGNTAAPSSTPDVGVTYIKGTCNNNAHFAVLPEIDILPDEDIIYTVSDLDLTTCKTMVASIPGAVGFAYISADGRCIIKKTIAPADTPAPVVWDAVDTYVLVDSTCYAQIPNFDMGTTHISLPGSVGPIPLCKEICDSDPSCLGFSYSQAVCNFRGSFAAGASLPLITPGVNLFIKGDCGSSTASALASDPAYYAFLPDINLTPGDGSADIGHLLPPADILHCTMDAEGSPVAKGFVLIYYGCTFKDSFTTTVGVEIDPTQLPFIFNFIRTGPGCYAAISGLNLFELENADPLLEGLSLKECRAACDQDAELSGYCMGFMRFMDSTSSFCKLLRRNNALNLSYKAGAITYLKGACNDKPYFAIIPGIDFRPNTHIHTMHLPGSNVYNDPAKDLETCKVMTASTPGALGFAIISDGRCIIKDRLTPLAPNVWDQVDTFVLVDKDCYGFVPNFDTGYNSGPTISAPIPTYSISACKAHCNSLGWACQAFVHGNDNVCHFRGFPTPALGINHGDAVGDFYVKGDCPS